MTSENISKNLQKMRMKIRLAEEHYKRLPGSVQLLAVSKQQSVEKIQLAIAEGQAHFGENYLQESLPKIAVLKKFSLKWHFLGHIQSNKTRQIAQHFDWVHSLDRIVVAQRLDAQRPEHLPPLNVCIEINISQKASKFGVSLQALIPLAQEITTLKRLRLRGLMVIPERDHDLETQFLGYQRIQKIQQDLCEQGYMLDTLSMGMSNDFTAAIGAGSTIVRVGTAIFGCRA